MRALGEDIGNGDFHGMGELEQAEHVTYTLRRRGLPSAAPRITDTVYSKPVTARHASNSSKHVERLNLVTGCLRLSTPLALYR